MIPVINHALLVVALTGQAFISSDIDRGIWFTGLVQEPVEIGIVFQASIINFMRGGIQRGIPRIKILCRYGFEINEFRDIYGIVNQGRCREIENLRQPFDFRNGRCVFINLPFLNGRFRNG